MAHLYKATEWQSASGKWFCNDIEELAGIGSLWWVPARMLNLTPAQYIEMLVKDFKPDYLKFDKILIFSWNSQSNMRKYKNFINAEARKRKFIV